jgi:hypothetical protein
MLIHAGLERESRRIETKEGFTLSNGQEVEVRCTWEITVCRFDQSHGPGLIEHTAEQEGEPELVWWEASPIPDGFEKEAEAQIEKLAPVWAEGVEL